LITKIEILLVLQKVFCCKVFNLYLPLDCCIVEVVLIKADS